MIGKMKMLKKNDVLNTTFEKYTVNCSIGEGGNGVVYKVTDSSGNVFAAKVICKNDLSAEKLKRFKNEVNFCQKYDHPNIVKIIDNGFIMKGDKEYLFYVMPLYDGSLKKLLSPTIEISQAVDFFLSICEGLKFAHDKGCIHRDIKPENILVNLKDKQVVVADFGVAHFSDDDKRTEIYTKETTRLANFNYHAPEQSVVGYVQRPTTDIYSLGLMLNAMITGVVPAGEDYKKIRDIDSDYSFLDSIVKKMISQNQDNRYQSIDEVLIDYKVRKEAAENELKIKSLREPLLMGEIHDSLTDNPISIVDIHFRGGQLVVKLSNNVNSEWVNCCRNAAICFTSYPVNFKYFNFYGDEAHYGGSINGVSDDLIKKLIEDLKDAIKAANIMYAKKLLQQAQKEQAEKERRRQEEIKRLEQENNLNNLLRDLI